MEHIDFFEDCTTLRWVKWTKRKPDYNGSIQLRFNGKNQGSGRVFRGELMTLEGDKVSKEFIKDYEDTFYWIEEIFDFEKFREYQNKLSEEFIKNKYGE